MPTKTYVSISSVSLIASSASVDFLSIPQNYRDLVLAISHPGPASATEVAIRFNSDSGNNYSRVYVEGRSEGLGTAFVATESANFVGAYGTGQSVNICNIFDYSVVDKHKLVLTNATTLEGIKVVSNRWINTSPVTSITAILFNTSFGAGSTLTLYGIEA
jgi:hypothetical protein